ncbi:hypothetical protein NIES21_27340 [Anabaenopsis circularis NIES-21]|uniref:Uncharacterized protein n=1 Tax=Anabaenopsis circularis NIES-21 TaxID=1085406 RepID=A0A1Z4GHC5_9CYAN|nr:hypothetical protein NIES21_27340 [Anabaenopsis circularis NIES-21]
MSYRTEIRPWAIFNCRLSGNICVARFRTRSDADAYMTILRQLSPSGNFEVVFDQLVEVKG